MSIHIRPFNQVFFCPYLSFLLSPLTFTVLLPLKIYFKWIYSLTIVLDTCFCEDTLWYYWIYTIVRLQSHPAIISSISTDLPHFPPLFSLTLMHTGSLYFCPFLLPSLQLPPCVSSNKQQQLKRQLHLSLRRPCRGLTCSELLYLLLSCSWRSPGCCVRQIHVCICFKRQIREDYWKQHINAFLPFFLHSLLILNRIRELHSIPQIILNGVE